jgi:hypothetical protein
LEQLLILVEQANSDLLSDAVSGVALNSVDSSILGSFASTGEPAMLCVVQFILGV